MGGDRGGRLCRREVCQGVVMIGIEAVLGMLAANLFVGCAVWFRLGRVVEKQEHVDVRLTRLELKNA